MAKTNLVELALYGGLAYLAYRLAENGAFGEKAKNWTDKNLKPKPSPGSGPANKQAPGFDSNNYVAPYGTGYVVFVNGHQLSGEWTTGVVNGVFPTQESAERAYNVARGFA